MANMRKSRFTNSTEFGYKIMAGAEPRDFCSQYPFGGEGFRPNAFTCDIHCVIYVDGGLVIKIQTLDQSKLTLSFYY